MRLPRSDVWHYTTMYAAAQPCALTLVWPDSGAASGTTSMSASATCARGRSATRFLRLWRWNGRPATTDAVSCRKIEM